MKIKKKKLKLIYTSSKDKKKNIMFIVCLVVVGLNSIVPVYAADDPLAVINNLSNFIFSITKAVGIIIMIFGVIQFGMSFLSHDPTQRANSIFTVLGGGIIACAKVILDVITK